MNGFYRSKVMAVLFIGMPLVAVLMYLLSLSVEGVALGPFTAVLISSMAGVLAATTLTVSIINERSQGVYDLFLVRPVRRSHLLLAKYIAVVTCVVLAAALAMVVANGYDWVQRGAVDLSVLGQPLLVTVTMVCVSCAAAVLVGSLVRTVLVGVILTLYGGNQLSAAAIMPSLLGMMPLELNAVLGLVVAAAVLCAAVAVFARRLNS